MQQILAKVTIPLRLHPTVGLVLRFTISTVKAVQRLLDPHLSCEDCFFFRFGVGPWWSLLLDVRCL